MAILLENITKSYKGKEIFKDFNISFNEGAITCILGPSGCGKTTLLNIIGGIVKPDKGALHGLDGKCFSYIFQEPRLLPWKTVRENIEFVLDIKIPISKRKEITNLLLNKIELSDFAEYYPSQLSGGMRQRVSIARAFACKSDIILMDEPLNGLDSELKKNMVEWFAQIWKEDKRTVIFVTHDIYEANMLGNHVYCFSKAPVSIISEKEINKP